MSGAAPSELGLKHMLLLEALQHAPSLSTAAAELGLSPSTATLLLRDLHAELGTPLIRRAGGGLRATDASRAMARWATLMLADFDAVRQSIGATSAGGGLRITLGTSQLIASWIVPAAVGRLTEAYPRSTVAIQTGVEEDLLPALAEGTLDIVVVRNLPPDDPFRPLRIEIVHEEPLLAVTGVGHRLTRMARIAPDAVSREPWVLPVTTREARSALLDQLARAGLDVARIVLQSGSPMMIVQLLQQCDAISLLPASLARQNAAYGLIAALPIDLGLRTASMLVAREAAGEDREGRATARHFDLALAGIRAAATARPR